MFILAAHALLVLTLRGENKGISPRTTRASATDNGENRWHFWACPSEKCSLSNKNDSERVPRNCFPGALFFLEIVLRTRFRKRLGGFFAGFLLFFGEVLEARFGEKVWTKWTDKRLFKNGQSQFLILCVLTFPKMRQIIPKVRTKIASQE